MVSTNNSVNLVWVTSRFGIPLFALGVVIGAVVVLLLYSRIRKSKENSSNRLVNKKNIIPFYSSFTEDKEKNVSRNARTKHLRSFSAQLTPPIKYMRQSPGHHHMRRNSSPTMSPLKKESPRESCHDSVPKIEKLLEAYSLFPVQSPFNWHLESPCKRYSGSTNKSRHLTPRVGVFKLVSTSTSPSPCLSTTTAAQQFPLVNPPPERIEK